MSNEPGNFLPINLSADEVEANLAEFGRLRDQICPGASLPVWYSLVTLAHELVEQNPPNALVYSFSNQETGLLVEIEVRRGSGKPSIQTIKELRAELDKEIGKAKTAQKLYMATKVELTNALAYVESLKQQLDDALRGCQGGATS